MSSKYQVREIRGIRMLAQSLTRALEKMENPPRPDDPPEKEYIPNDKYWEYYEMWNNPHPATKVVESGYFCILCGSQIRNDSWHICR
jgi:hypothetical protein